MNQRASYADFLRILACFGVIMVHTVAGILLSVSPSTVVWKTANVLSALVRFCVPVFFMISGVFFLDPNKEISGKKLFSKYILRLIIALIFWAVMYEVLPVVFKALTSGVVDIEALKAGAISILKGRGHFHLYFIYILVGLYIVCPILRVFTKHATKRTVEYFLVLYFLFTGVLPFVFKFTPLKLFAFNITQMQLHLVLGYIGYFVAGFYLSKYPISERNRRILYVLGAISCLCAVLGTSRLSIAKGMTDGSFYDGLSPFTMLYSVAVFEFVKNLDLKIKLKGKVKKKLEWVSNMTFGIYLMHDFFNMLIRALGVQLKNYNVLIVSPLYSLAVFIICMFITACIKKIPWINRYVV